MAKTRFTTKIDQIFRLFRWLTLHPLNRENKLHAVSRFMRWQIAARLLPEAIFGLPFVNGSVLLVQKGMAGATGNWYSGLDEVHEMGFIAHVLSDGDLFIDVGANIGSYSILAAAGCSCKVISIEPSKGTFSVLQRNIKVNNLEHLVETRCLALSNTSGSIRFTTNCDTTNHVVAEGEIDAAGVYETVTVTTLDDLLGERYSSSCKVIKLDVEGYELNVLKGATRTLASEDLLAIIVEINGSSSRYSGTDDEIVNFLQGMGFSSFKYDAIGRKVNGGGAANQVMTSENLIFTRNLRRVEGLIRSRGDRKIKVSNGYV